MSDALHQGRTLDDRHADRLAVARLAAKHVLFVKGYPYDDKVMAEVVEWAVREYESNERAKGAVDSDSVDAGAVGSAVD